MLSKSQKGYISITLIFFALALSFFLYPRDYPKIKPVSTDCALGNKPGSPDFEIELPKIKDRDEGNTPAPAARLQGGPEIGTTARYRLVREAVPFGPGRDDTFIFTSPYHSVLFNDSYPVTKPGGQTKNYTVYYPANYGEFDADFEFPATYDNEDYIAPKLNNQYRFRQEGFLYFVHRDDNGPIARTIDNKTIWLVDLYQDVDIINETSRFWNDGRIFKCTEGQSREVTIRRQNTVAEPSQFKSTDKKQLQLQWFLFGDTIYMGAHCKPAIYLYPKEKTLVNVKVNTKGFLSYVDPPYDSKKGWNVTAYPDGKLETASYQLPVTSYPYLYYESKIPDQLIKKPASGWVVEKKNFSSHFAKILPGLGLNTIQTNDFIDYWGKALPDSPYYFVGVIDQDNLNAVEPLEITPIPDYVNRVRIYFEAMDEFKEVAPPDIKTINDERLTMNDFRVVEWGGMVKRDKNHNFICSE